MFLVSRVLRRYRAIPAACIVALTLAACVTPPPETGATKVALAESPELTLRIVNTHDGAIRISGPAGNTFDILEGESVDLRFVVVALADFQETFFRTWLVPAGPIVQTVAELDEPGLMTISGLDVEIHYLVPDQSRSVIRGSARRCPGPGWRAAGVTETEFVVRTTAATSAPIPLCPGAGA
jgi:hypothetical protein